MMSTGAKIIPVHGRGPVDGSTPPYPDADAAPEPQTPFCNILFPVTDTTPSLVSTCDMRRTAPWHSLGPFRITRLRSGRDGLRCGGEHVPRVYTPSDTQTQLTQPPAAHNDTPLPHQPQQHTT